MCLKNSNSQQHYFESASLEFAEVEAIGNWDVMRCEASQPSDRRQILNYLANPAGAEGPVRGMGRWADIRLDFQLCRISAFSSMKPAKRQKLCIVGTRYLSTCHASVYGSQPPQPPSEGEDATSGRSSSTCVHLSLKTQTQNPFEGLDS